jgi:putative intracellular protease/amidase
MHIAILTFDGFNELDSLVAFGILNRIKKPDWRVSLSCPTPTVTSMNGVTLHAQSTLTDACHADAVLFGSGMKTRDVANDEQLMAQLRLDPAKQLIGAQCSGTLLLAKLGFLKKIPACTDLLTKPWVQEAGVEVLNQPFYAAGNLATAGIWQRGSLLGLRVLMLPSLPCTTSLRLARRNFTLTGPCRISLPICQRSLELVALNE